MSAPLQEPHRWGWEHGIDVLDPDGWRIDDKSFYEPITEAEFLERASASTIRIDPKKANECHW